MWPWLIGSSPDGPASGRVIAADAGSAADLAPVVSGSARAALRSGSGSSRVPQPRVVFERLRAAIAIRVSFPAPGPGWLSCAGPGSAEAFFPSFRLFSRRCLASPARRAGPYWPPTPPARCVIAAQRGNPTPSGPIQAVPSDLQATSKRLPSALHAWCKPGASASLRYLSF